MAQDVQIRNIEQPSDIAASHTVMLALRPHLTDADAFTAQVMRQREKGYCLAAAWHADEVVGLIGYRLQENLLHGRFVFVDDLVVRPDFRSDGLGAQLLSFARTFARASDCRYFVLDTGLHMALAQRFYYRQGMLAHAMGFSELLIDDIAAAAA